MDQAEVFFQDGVKAALAQEPYNIAAVPANYNAQLSFAGLTKEQKLDKIGTQKWIQLFGRSYEAFIVEWRHLCFESLVGQEVVDVRKKPFRNKDQGDDYRFLN